MGATTTFAEPRIIDKDKPLALRYGLSGSWAITWT